MSFVRVLRKKEKAKIATNRRWHTKERMACCVVEREWTHRVADAELALEAEQHRHVATGCQVEEAVTQQHQALQAANARAGRVGKNIN